MRIFHQKTDLSVGLVRLTDSLTNDWPDTLIYNITQTFKKVKYKLKSCVDSPGIEPGRLGVSSQSSEPAEPTRAIVYHTLSILFILFIFHFSFFIYVSPAYASHPPIDPANTSNIPLGQYCESATKTRYADCLYLPGNPPCHTFLAQCAADEDCVQLLPDSSGYKFTECRAITSGAPPSIPGNFGPDAAGLAQIESVFSRVISLFVGGAFVALAVVLVWAGIKFLTSGGDPKALEAARNTVTWALLGILFLAIAWLVLQLIAAFTGIEGLKTFDIKTLCNVAGTDWCKPTPTP